MPQPQQYLREHDFTLDEKSDMDVAALNKEFDNIAVTTEALRSNLALIQTDEGGLQPGIVNRENLGADVVEMFEGVVTEAQSVATEAARRSEAAADRSEKAAASAEKSQQTVERLEESTTINAKDVAQKHKDIGTMVNHVEPVLQNIEDVKKVGQNIEHVVNTSQNMDDIKVLSTDIKGGTCYPLIFSAGSIADPIDKRCEAGGAIGTVAKDIANVNKVAGLSLIHI